MTEGVECDFVWPAHRLVVEVDGPHHLTRETRRNDLARDRRLTGAGWRVLRFAPEELETHAGPELAAHLVTP
jgi:very-short-patch-repair endonuclease